MFAVRRTALALCAVALVTLAGCAATSHTTLTSSADTLATKAAGFAKNAQLVPDKGNYTHSADAEELAARAQDFRQAVQSNGDVKGSFDQLSQSYAQVRDTLDAANSTWLRDSWRPVKDAYLDVADAMDALHSQGRVAEDSGTHDR